MLREVDAVACRLAWRYVEPVAPHLIEQAMIERCSSPAHRGWSSLRATLWPDSDRAEHLEEMARMCEEPGRFVAFVAIDGCDNPVGFVEVAIRTDYVNGTNSSPVAFLEGLYVASAARQRGHARALVAEASRWAIAAGCTELASDALLANTRSHSVHRALGFEEMERVVYFRRVLRDDEEAS
jgi:aminoglycoside 6'-N-acetyltransferase I